MTRRIGAGAGKTTRHRWPLVGFLLVIAVVGHAALMAGGVHAASPPAHQTALHPPTAHASDPDLGAVRTGAGAMRGDCGTGQAVAPRGADLKFGGPASVVSSDPFAAVATLLRMDHAPDPPTLPPRVRRALLQVFRI